MSAFFSDKKYNTPRYLVFLQWINKGFSREHSFSNIKYRYQVIMIVLLLIGEFKLVWNIGKTSVHFVILAICQIDGSRILVINALRKSRHISHLTLNEALDIIQAIKPEKAYLIHMSHFLGKHEEVQKTLPITCLWHTTG